jgi:hypothetical protein
LLDGLATNSNSFVFAFLARGNCWFLFDVLERGVLKNG